MSTTSSFQLIEDRQAQWASRHRIPLGRKGYAAELADNLLLRRLNDETLLEFKHADGAELRDSGSRPAKMGAVISSSALAVNFFDPWRDAPKAALQHALGLEQPISDLRFEYKCERYPVPPRSPNLDLFLTLENLQKVGIESKFAEPYRDPGVDSPLSLRYHPSGNGFWSDRGLRHCQQLVDSLRGEWDYLDVPQLTKHILGLRADTNDLPVRLLYLWFDTGLPDAQIHRTEIERFREMIHGDDVLFAGVSYQELFRRLRVGSFQPTAEWTDYLAGRYFA